MKTRYVLVVAVIVVSIMGGLSVAFALKGHHAEIDRFYELRPYYESVVRENFGKVQIDNFREIDLPRGSALRVCKITEQDNRLHFLVRCTVPSGPNLEIVYAPTNEAVVNLINEYLNRFNVWEMRKLSPSWYSLYYID